MLDSLKSANLKRWQACVVNAASITQLDRVAKRLITAKERYQSVEKKTNVPWPVIAVIHEREASQSWMANLAQGDRWDRVSTHIPRGQGPFKSWEEAAINALTADKLSAWGDWSIGSTLTALEKYNGLGYYNKGRPSPYVWSKTNQYKSGKYVADGVYSPTAVDVQDGCAALLKRMMVQDSTISPKYGWDKAKAPTVVAPIVVAAGGTGYLAWAGHHAWAIAIGIAVVVTLGIYIYNKIKGPSNVVVK